VAIFEPDVPSDEEAKALLQTESAQRVIVNMVKRLKEHSGSLTPESFKEMILATGQETGLKGKDLYFPIRGAMTGSVHGPDLTRVAAVKGKDVVLRLLEAARR
jgi:nondiscriminating glutamyl-tRNA synthetase